MKKIILTITVLSVLISCNPKKESQDKEIKDQKSESTEIKEAAKNVSQDKIYKTKTGMQFAVAEEKTSASLSKISVTPIGFTEVNETIQMEESDPFDYALIADVNNDGFDELYIITRGAGSGSYANIYGFASNTDKSVTPIYNPELSDDDFVTIFQGYMGHDKFYVQNDKLFRKYPVYKKEDSNANPTGGDKVLEYDLKIGESGWILEIKK